MREALDDMDGSGRVDDVIRQTSNLYLSDDYKEVKDHVVSYSKLKSQLIETNACSVVNRGGIF